MLVNTDMGPVSIDKLNEYKGYWYQSDSSIHNRYFNLSGLIKPISVVRYLGSRDNYCTLNVLAIRVPNLLTHLTDISVIPFSRILVTLHSYSFLLNHYFPNKLPVELCTMLDLAMLGSNIVTTYDPMKFEPIERLSNASISSWS